MRFYVVDDSQTQSAARPLVRRCRSQLPHGHRGCSGRGGMRTGCGRVRCPELARGGIVRGNDLRCDDGLEFSFARQHRCLRRVSAESQYLQ